MSEPFSDDVARVRRLLRDTLAGEPLSDECRAFALGGKHLRARLLFAASAGNPVLSAGVDVARAAAAIELVHAGSLFHDDIVDACDVRRGVPALHRVHGVEAATRSGLHLVELARALAADLPSRARERIGLTARRLSRGQFLELIRLGDMAMRPDERMRIMQLKTASVIGLSCELGAMLVGEPIADTKRWRRIGEAFGLLFQVADDLDDVFGSAAELGRQPGADLRDGVMSLPILCGLETAHRPALVAALRDLRCANASATAVHRCGEILRSSGAIDRTVRLAEAHADAVQGHCGALPATRGTEWMVALTQRTLARCSRWLPRPELHRTD